MLLQTKKEQGMPSIMIVSLLLEKQEQQKSNKAKVIQQEQNLVANHIQTCYCSPPSGTIENVCVCYPQVP